MNDITIQVVINSIATSIGYSLISISIFGQFNYLKIVSISLLPSMILGAYTANGIYIYAGDISIIIPLFAACLVGSLSGLVGSKIHIIIGKEKGVLGLLASLGYFYFVQGLIVVITGGGILSFKLSFPRILPTDAYGGQPEWLMYSLIIMFTLLVLNYLIFSKTKLRIEALSIGDDYELASLFGLSYKNIESKIHLIGGAIGGLAGVVIALDRGLQPYLGFGDILKVFAILIISKEKLLLVPIWAILLASIENISSYFLGGQISQAIGLSFVLLTIFFNKIHTYYSNLITIDKFSRNLSNREIK